MKTLKLAFAALLAVGLSVATVNAQTSKKQKSTTQTTTPKSTSGNTKHLKKDGTPDMRYKENKEAAKKSAPAKTAPKSTKSPAAKGKAKPAAKKGSTAK